ncbi:MAG TPA: 50S ribosomal protein L28 [Elusimicrobia bacterium]|nr:MAG: 50S ribosomal protein L28 [Elusimicrobia bacterium RIFOXYA12_FULL_49_49]OGS09452.1 MAG: 50S ribosomal protein L28 [Elusimicrobia bacterium RIFOXYA1_FULL_47_7]OGS15923.1 MAG: 50S ribosomal protein L28 [Elusimicrobia bacterium RIFOXYA2_FULL_47_53]OGS26395.1 MAG: 50S ribosomal protein L28 [Elusimicrobia bacterium RIFOXYB12_FULL_50_12]OGS29091.1 MAG: 50S ribosomal protein L28 [Elusimicrobia bacterium RIFOXYB2_FULL_46_23]HBU69182.1 50S ribosomal protein L28 [Elusimicrobiota bacterium]
MSFKCSVCGKGPTSGKTVSHSHRKTNRIFKPNLQRQKISLNGKARRVYVCTSCIRSGKVKKAA